MAVNDYIAAGLQPFNAASTLAFIEDLKGAKSQNALMQLQLAQEQDPASSVNRAREIELRQGSAEADAMELQNAVPRLSAALQAMESVKRTIASKGVSAGRQRLSEQMSFLQSQGILPKDFDLGIDPSELSDDEFLSEIEQSEQSIADTLSSFAPSDSRTSAAIGDMQTLGYEMTPEGFAKYNKDRGASGLEMLDTVQAQLAIESLRLQNEARVRDQEQAEESRNAERTAQQQSITRNLNQNLSAVDLTENLQGTILESGSVLPADIRRGLASFQQFLLGATGHDTSELEQMIADFDTQRKTLQDQVNARIASGQYGQSATQLNSIERSLANQNISPEAIIRIQGQLAQLDLDKADAMGLDIEGRDEWEKRAKEWKSYSITSPTNISKMSLDQIRSLDIDSMSDEQATAAAARVRELRNAGP